MSLRRQREQQYSKLASSLNNFLRNSTGYDIHGVARQGSRKERTHRDESDLDIIFALAGNPRKDEIYPNLEDLIPKVLKIQADIGEDYNVINLLKGDLEVDLVLLTIADFERQCQEGRYRRMVIQTKKS